MEKKISHISYHIYKISFFLFYTVNKFSKRAEPQKEIKCNIIRVVLAKSAGRATRQQSDEMQRTFEQQRNEKRHAAYF